MLKKLVAGITAAVLMGVSVSAFAVPPELLITEAYAFTGVLYFCDSTAKTVVLKDVRPLSTGEGAARMAVEAEYNELMMTDTGYSLQDGSKLNLEDLNIYADSNVRAVIVRNALGIKVVSLKFL